MSGSRLESSGPFGPSGLGLSNQSWTSLGELSQSSGLGLLRLLEPGLGQGLLGLSVFLDMDARVPGQRSSRSEMQ